MNICSVNILLLKYNILKGVDFMYGCGMQPCCSNNNNGWIWAILIVIFILFFIFWGNGQNNNF